VRPVGVDEAGKGPVLGSLFAAAVAADPAELPDGVGDSKAIPDGRREELAANIQSDPAVAIGLAEVTPDRIDDPGADMNGLTVAAHVEALVDLSIELGDRSVHCDAGDTDADRFAGRVADGLEATVAVSATHGADAADPLVGAASIVAKQAREDHVAALAEEYGAIGSGYPSDPTTRTFLAEYVAEHGSLPDCARRSWATSADVLAAAEQADLSEF
jgi:ribonuclease HII